jgi:hypothetical protein
MRAILEFNLDEIEDKENFDKCMRATDLCLLLWNFDQYLRSQIKYNNSLSSEECKAHEKVREKLNDMIQDASLNLDNLVR